MTWHPPLEMDWVRDFAISLDGWFAAGEIVREFDVSYAKAGDYLRELVRSDVLEQKGERAGRRYRYVYATGARPLPPDPTHKPRGEPRIIAVGGVVRGQIVPHTRPEGPSNKPGRDKKRQARGVTVKRRKASGHS